MNPAFLEPVKWLAFAAMVADHVDLLVFGRSLPLLHGIGRFAYPSFAVCFGIGLATSSKPYRVVDRLFGPALAAQLAWWCFDVTHPANVLVVFALCAIAAQCLRDQQRVAAAVLLAGLLLCAPWIEGGPFGVLAVAGGFAAGRMGQYWPAAVGLLPWAVVLPSAGVFAAAASPLVASGWRLVLPRHGGVLAWAYAAHLAVLVALRAALGAPL